MKVRPAALLVREGCILTLYYRYSQSDLYGLPGGNPDPGETLEEALRRELHEELGIEVQVGPLLFCGEVALPGREDVLHCVFEAWLPEAQSPVVNPAHTSALEYRWLPTAEAPDKLLYPNLGRVLHDYLHGTRGTGYVGRIEQPFVS
jgi:8-oxo-dGTP pyrophosphatase MutT (NUDIX family)